jgi:hypothetical protein
LSGGMVLLSDLLCLIYVQNCFMQFPFPAFSSTSGVTMPSTYYLDNSIKNKICHTTAQTKDGYPWINRDLKKLIRKGNRSYKRKKKSGNEAMFYICYLHLTQTSLQRANVSIDQS